MKQQTLLDVDPAARRDQDFYPTPIWMTRALLNRVMVGGWAGRMVEPCVGDGAISKLLDPLVGNGGPVLTNDIVPRGDMVPEFLLDARKPETWAAFQRTGKLAVVVTNPPFDVAFDIVQQAVECADVVVCMLLRLSWLEPTDERGEWLAAHSPRTVIVLPRHDFRGNGSTDSVTSGWVIWSQYAVCDAGVQIVTKRERDEFIAQYGKS